MNRPNPIVRILARLLRPVIAEALKRDNPGTTLSGDWINSVVEDISEAVRKAGVSESPGDDLCEAVRRLRQASLDEAKSEERMRDRVRAEVRGDITLEVAKSIMSAPLEETAQRMIDHNLTYRDLCIAYVDSLASDDELAWLKVFISHPSVVREVFGAF